MAYRKEIIGDATLYLGDCLEVMADMEPGSVDAVVTDPPYGIDYQSARRSDPGMWKPKIAGDKDLSFIPDFMESIYRVTVEAVHALRFLPLGQMASPVW